MVIPAGTSVGLYHVISQRGARGMGEVYRARDPRLSRDVAQKVLLSAASRTDEAVATLQPAVARITEAATSSIACTLRHCSRPLAN
jgi:serine/threonine protein kinase